MRRISWTERWSPERTFSLNRHRAGSWARVGGCADRLPARCPLAAPLLPPVGLADMGLGVGWGRVRHSAGAREPGKEPQIQIPRFPFRSPIFTTLRQPPLEQSRRMGTVGKGKNCRFE